MHNIPYKALDAVLFDLDGTLLDTAPDLGAALNQLLREEGREQLDHQVIRPYASHGAKGLIELGFGTDLAPDMFDSLRTRFLDEYEQNLCVNSVVFKGGQELLGQLDSCGIRWGIVTNKPGWLTDPLLTNFPQLVSSGCVISGDTLPVRKPDPQPLLHACELLNVDAAKTLYVGDAERDIQAGLNAGMYTLVANYGYLRASDTPDSWQAHGAIDSLEQLQQLLGD